MNNIPKTTIPTLDDTEFLKEVDELIEKDSHADFWKEKLEDYQIYKKFFQTVFIPPKELGLVYLFHVTYLRTEKDRLVWREVEIMGSHKLEKQEKKIIHDMGWYNDHLYAFRFPSPAENRWGTKVRHGIMIDYQGQYETE